MEIFQIIGLGIVGSVLLVLLRKERPEMSLGVALTLGVVICLGVMPKLVSVVSVFGAIASESGLEPLYFGVVLRALGISYAADLGAAVCRDAGEGAVAGRVEAAGKVLILATALPIVKEVALVIKSFMVP